MDPVGIIAYLHFSFCVFVRCGTEHLCVPVSPCTTGFHIKCSVEMRTGIGANVLMLHSRTARHRMVTMITSFSYTLSCSVLSLLCM